MASSTKPPDPHEKELEALRHAVLEAFNFLSEIESYPNLERKFNDSIRRLSIALTQARVASLDDELRRLTFWQSQDGDKNE